MLVVQLLQVGAMVDQKTQSVETIKYCSVMRWGPAISLGLQLADLGLFREDVVQKKYVTI